MKDLTARFLGCVAGWLIAEVCKFAWRHSAGNVWAFLLIAAMAVCLVLLSVLLVVAFDDWRSARAARSLWYWK